MSRENSKALPLQHAMPLHLFCSLTDGLGPRQRLHSTRPRVAKACHSQSGNQSSMKEVVGSHWEMPPNYDRYIGANPALTTC